MAKEARLRPGDRAVIRGTVQQQTVALENGQTTSINHLYVTAIEVLSRSKRTSITAYEKREGNITLSFHWRVSALFEDIRDRHINVGGLSCFALCFLSLSEGEAKKNFRVNSTLSPVQCKSFIISTKSALDGDCSLRCHRTKPL